MMPFAIELELKPGEKILWQGKPKQGFRFRAADMFIIPFSVVWASVALPGFSHITTQHNSSAPPPILFEAFFAFIAFYILIGRFFVDIAMRSKTQYALTNERAIIVSGFFTRKVTSLNLKTMPDYSVSEKSDGSGTIIFNASSSPYRRYSNFTYMPGSRSQPPAFDMIKDVRTVDSLIKKNTPINQQAAQELERL